MIEAISNDPSPPLWGRAGEGGGNGSSGHDDRPVGAIPPSLLHKGGGDRVAHAEVGARQRAQAKQLRRELTPAERKLWHGLKAHRFQGLHIRRQVPMGSYIVDFVCHRTKLVIEVDGAQHGFERGIAADEVRDAWLSSQGYRVLRFWNRDVLTELDSVLDTIFAHLPIDLPEAGDRS
ncbi:endonuclease domain-containing protein [Microvirga sp. 2MCAF38]|uniref:endonuclease domain-containing protein n=1 Tax=Microvirga sp. 2MCAF38 TaxID=3232989 RepID=UPI003F990C2B